MAKVFNILFAAFLTGFILLDSPVCVAIGPNVNKTEAQAREAVLDVARSQIGVRELGHNSGPQIKQYLLSVGLAEGKAYCVAFVNWCLLKAGFQGANSGWSPAWFPNRRLVMQPQPGDVGGIYFPNLGRIGHGFLIEKWGTTVLTIEANTNAQGSREGSGVWRRRRLARQITKVSDWIS